MKGTSIKCGLQCKRSAGTMNIALGKVRWDVCKYSGNGHNVTPRHLNNVKCMVTMNRRRYPGFEVSTKLLSRNQPSLNAFVCNVWRSILAQKWALFIGALKRGPVCEVNTVQTAHSVPYWSHIPATSIGVPISKWLQNYRKFTGMLVGTSSWSHAGNNP